MKVLITTLPPQDIVRPPGILSILAGCCESIDVDYVIEDLNLHLYKTLPQEVTTEVISDLFNNHFRSSTNQQYYQRICNYYVDQIRLHRPSHLAISVFTYVNILAADILLKHLKQVDVGYDYKIVIGGLGVSSRVDDITGAMEFGDYCLTNNLVDYCIYGEGDLAFVELLKGNNQYPGINQKNQSQLLDLNVLPRPSYKNIHPNEYFHSGSPEVLITGSRGCVRDCSFCNVGHFWEKYVYKSGSILANELFDIWQTTGVQKFDFSDSLINGSIKTFREFNQAIIRYKEQYPDFKPLYKGQFICRPAGQLKESDYREMALAGAETLVVGIESFSKNVRDHMRKKFDNHAIDWHFEMSAKYGIKNVLLLLAGYLTETIEDHQTTIDYLKKYQVYALSRTIYAINIAVQGLSISEGSPLYKNAEELGIIFHPASDSSSDWHCLTNPSLTQHERLRRGVELIYTAYSLGYKVLHFNQKLDFAEQEYKKLQSTPQQKVFELIQV